MKKRGHIWSSLLILSLLSMCQFSFAQEENFNLPGDDRRPEGRRTGIGLEGEYLNDSYGTTKPESKENNRHKTSTTSYGNNSEVGRENGPTTSGSHIESPKQLQKSISSSNISDSKKEEKDQQANQEEEEQDESVLSFNFLYYMIQKFKFSDVIE